MAAAQVIGNKMICVVVMSSRIRCINTFSLTLTRKGIGTMRVMQQFTAELLMRTFYIYKFPTM